MNENRLTTLQQIKQSLSSVKLLIGQVLSATIDALIELEGKITPDTWKANTVDNEGYVAKGKGNPNKVWGTDAEGNPGWINACGIDIISTTEELNVNTTKGKVVDALVVKQLNNNNKWILDEIDRSLRIHSADDIPNLDILHSWENKGYFSFTNIMQHPYLSKFPDNEHLENGILKVLPNQINITYCQQVFCGIYIIDETKIQKTYTRIYMDNSMWTEWTSIEDNVTSLKKSVSDGKTLVADAITAKGIQTATDATFQAMADNIDKIRSEPILQEKSATLDIDKTFVSLIPDKDYDGISKSTVNIEIQEKTLAFSTKAQIVTPDSGKVLSKVTTSAVADYSNTTQDAQLTIDSGYAYMNIPSEGFYNKNSKCRAQAGSLGTLQIPLFMSFRDNYLDIVNQWTKVTFDLKLGVGGSATYPQTFYVRGSQDGIAWTELYKKTIANNTGPSYINQLVDISPYKYVRLVSSSYMTSDTATNIIFGN